MSFHLSSSDIHIRHENGSTMLLCHVRDLHGKMVLKKIRLDDHIGNSDGTPSLFCPPFNPQMQSTRLIRAGWFVWGGVNFTQSAHNIALENTDHGPKLTADLPMSNGGSRGRQGMFLADKIENQDGHLKFLVSDSNRRLHCRWFF